MPTTNPITPPPSSSYVTAGVTFHTIQEVVTFASAASYQNLVNTIPTGAIVISATIKIVFNIATTTAVKIGVGKSSGTPAPSLYLLTSGLTAREVGNLSFGNSAEVDNPSQPAVYACATDGTAAGTISAGQSVEVRLVYMTSDLI